MNHSFICFSALLLIYLHDLSVMPPVWSESSGLLSLQIPFSVNIQELTHILRATYFSSQVANRKEKQGHSRAGSSNGCAPVNPIASLWYLLKSWLAWLMKSLWPFVSAKCLLALVWKLIHCQERSIDVRSDKSTECNAANNTLMKSIFTLHRSLEKHFTKAVTHKNTNCELQ